MISRQVCFFLVKYCLGYVRAVVGFEVIKQGFQFVGDSFLQGNDERGDENEIPDENGDDLTDQLNCETRGKVICICLFA